MRGSHRHSSYWPAFTKLAVVVLALGALAWRWVG